MRKTVNLQNPKNLNLKMRFMSITPNTPPHIFHFIFLNLPILTSILFLLREKYQVSSSLNIISHLYSRSLISILIQFILKCLTLWQYDIRRHVGYKFHALYLNISCRHASSLVREMNEENGEEMKNWINFEICWGYMGCRWGSFLLED